VRVHVDERGLEFLADPWPLNAKKSAKGAPLGTLLRGVPPPLHLPHRPGAKGDDDVLGKIHNRALRDREVFVPAQYLPGDPHDGGHGGVVGTHTAIDEVESTPEHTVAVVGIEGVRLEEGQRGGGADADISQFIFFLFLSSWRHLVRGEGDGI
jgi:hypothetical protein